MPTVATILARSAVLLNDAAQQSYTNTAMLPYYNVAQDELNEEMEANNVSYTNRVSASLLVDIGDTDIGGATGPALPTDLIEVRGLWERQNGTTVDFVEMDKVDFIPKTSIQSSNLGVWAWVGQIIELVGATTARDVKLDYISSRLATVTDPTTNITLFNAISFLAYRTAALSAEFIGENPTRAQSLNAGAALAKDRFLSISAKSQQVMPTKRRPFQAALKMLRRI